MGFHQLTEDTAINKFLGNRVLRRINLETGRITNFGEPDFESWPFPFKNSKPNRRRIRDCLVWAKSKLNGEHVLTATRVISDYTGPWNTPIGSYLKSQLITFIGERPENNFGQQKQTFTIYKDGYDELVALEEFYKEV